MYMHYCKILHTYKIPSPACSILQCYNTACIILSIASSVHNHNTIIIIIIIRLFSTENDKSDYIEYTSLFC